jgi:fermentation-respiration switch protein FrsA (DUF1100 family)
MLYQPSPAHVGEWGDAKARGFEEVDFESHDSTKLHGWFYDHPKRQAVVLFLHGNGGNVATWAEPVRELAVQHRLSVFLFDYRGYGKSEGAPTEAGLGDDAAAARAWLANRTGVSEESIVLFGRSLGGAVAVDAATSGPPPRGLVLVSTFTSAPKVAAHHMPWLPAGLVMSQRFPSESRIKAYEQPLLIAHGDADRVIPFAQGEKLFEAAGSEDKQFVRLRGRDHNDPLSQGFHDAFDAFLSGLPPESKATAAIP